MTINGKQMTMTWPFNDLKILHVGADEVSKVIEWMKGTYHSHMKEYSGNKCDG